MHSLKVRIARREDYVGPSDTSPTWTAGPGSVYGLSLRVSKWEIPQEGVPGFSNTCGPHPGAPKGKLGDPAVFLKEEPEGQVVAKNMGGYGF